MARALEPEDRFQAALHYEPGVGLGRVSLRSLAPNHGLAWNQDETVCAVMEGELYDVPALAQSLDLEDEARRESLDGPGLIVRLYERYGEEFAKKLNGAFAVAIWDRRARKLMLVNDRLGLFPLYYAQVNGALVFASGVRALLADPELDRSVDLVAINQFLVYDHMLDDRTLLNSVRLLPPGSILTSRARQISIRPYWTLRYPDFYEPQSDGAYVEQLMHYLRQAVARQQPDHRPAGVLLSGGLDSRLLLALLRERSPAGSLHTFTFGIPGCDDARYAREVAIRLAAQHHFLELKPGWLLGWAEEAVRLTDGLGNIVNLHALATAEEESQFAQVIYKGFMGDAMLGFALKRQMWADYSPDARVGVHLGVHAEQGVINYGQAQQHQLFTCSFQKRVGTAIYQTYQDAMDRSGTTQLANQRLYFDLTQRVRRMTINGVEVVRSRAITRLPFCDNDLIDFALTVPPGFLFGRYLASEALMRYYPKLAQIPVAGPNRPVTLCARDLLIQCRQLLSWHLERAGLGWMNGASRRPYKDYNGWFRSNLRPWVEGLLLSPRALERGYFKPEKIRELVAEQMAGVNHGGRIGALLTVELFHKQFLD